MRLSGIVAMVFLFVACQKGKDTVVEQKKTDRDSTLAAKVIYGADNRKDLYQVSDPLQLELADSTVALMQSSDLRIVGDVAQILGGNFGTELNLCPSEPYREQMLAAFCSGFLVAEDIVVTAGHCITDDQDCSSTRFVFGFGVKAQGVQPSQVNSSQVYACKSIIKRVQEAKGTDYGVIRLDRPVRDHQPLRLRRTGAIAVGDEIVVIGHPVGLPTKVADGAQVRAINAKYFSANLDTYGGNSGSAVFNKATGDVEGILVRGETDFKNQGSCTVSNVCSDTGCMGEDVTLISSVLPSLPAVEEPEDPPSDGDEVEFASSELLSIPDNAPVGVVAEINANEAPNGRKVLVELQLQHTWRGDLKITLIAPDGQRVILHDRAGGSADDVRGVYGVDLVSREPLEPLREVTVDGIWKLEIADLAGLDVGQLQSWKLRFKP